MDEPVTIKVGEKEYAQEDLNKLVGLGEIAQEYQTKWDRDIKGFYPDYIHKSQELAEYKKRDAEQAKLAEEEKQKVIVEKAKANELSPEEARQYARQQAKDLEIVMYDDAFKTEVNRVVAENLAGKQLIDDATVIINEAVEKGQPKVDIRELFKYMDENGVKSPEKAYKLMFESEIDKWKEEKLKSIRPNSFQTQDQSTAGGKQPPSPAPISKEDLGKAIRESLTRSSGAYV